VSSRGRPGLLDGWIVFGIPLLEGLHPDPDNRKIPDVVKNTRADSIFLIDKVSLPQIHGNIFKTQVIIKIVQN
jgi:hypothetical protein